jgi:proteasome lid subunit RPN8/RPN11
MLQISQPIYLAMLDHLQAVYPREGCGLLAGQGEQASHLYAIDNIRQSPTRFEMDPLQQVKAMLHMEARGWSLLAIYHSHPQGPETPSATDVARAYYPEAAHLIVSLRHWAQPVVRAFTIVDGRVDEIALATV